MNLKKLCLLTLVIVHYSYATEKFEHKSAFNDSAEETAVLLTQQASIKTIHPTTVLAIKFMRAADKQYITTDEYEEAVKAALPKQLTPKAKLIIFYQHKTEELYNIWSKVGGSDGQAGHLKNYLTLRRLDKQKSAPKITFSLEQLTPLAAAQLKYICHSDTKNVLKRQNIDQVKKKLASEKLSDRELDFAVRQQLVTELEEVWIKLGGVECRANFMAESFCDNCEPTDDGCIVS